MSAKRSNSRRTFRSTIICQLTMRCSFINLDRFLMISSGMRIMVRELKWWTWPLKRGLAAKKSDMLSLSKIDKLL